MTRIIAPGWSIWLRDPLGAGPHIDEHFRLVAHILNHAYTDWTRAMSNEADQFLAGGARAVKFEKPGDKVVGIVLSYELRQQTDFKSKQPKFYDDGGKMMEVIWTLQTDERDSTVENDDGRRNKLS